jgi:membrane protein
MGTTREIGSPAAVPARAWGDTFKRILREFRDDKLNHWAAALTYYGVLCIFPALLAMVSLVGLVADPARVTQLLTDTISQLGPASAERTVRGPVESLTASRGTAGAMFAVGVVAALWSASGYVGAFADACNAMYGVQEGRPFWKRKPLQVLVTLVLIVLAGVVALSLLLTGPIVAALGSALGISDQAVMAWRLAKWPAMILLVLLIFCVLYFATPNVRMRGLRWVLPGALVALVVWIVASVAFAVYVSSFGSYQRTYGALGGVAVFLLWMWISNLAIVLGAECNAELERTRQLAAGVPGAEREIKLEAREAPSGGRPPRTRDPYPQGQQRSNDG